ncbi:hypothetical protein D9M71_765690 [compost metagenome]
MSQFEPGLGEGKFKLVRFFQKAMCDLFIGWIKPQREIGGEHNGRVAFVLDVCVGDHHCGRRIGWRPLDCSSRALGLDPSPAKKVRQVLIGEGRWA